MRDQQSHMVVRAPHYREKANFGLTDMSMTVTRSDQIRI